MVEEKNISELMNRRLPPESVEILHKAVAAATEPGYRLYLVGGVVRDLLLERDNLDLDIVVEGDAIDLAKRFAGIVGGRITVHPGFRTARVKWNGYRIDLVTARSETYSRPGALPTVKPGTIDDDLARRDFTINSMAVDLSAEGYGRLLDPFNGRGDIENKLIRVFHDASFTDDATRIWRAVRYEQRLDFKLEPETMRLLRRDIEMLDTISRDRIRHELELVLAEAEPEKMLRRAGELGVLEKLHPGLKGDDWLACKFREIRQATPPDRNLDELYMVILGYRLDAREMEDFAAGLILRSSQMRIFRDIVRLKCRMEKLGEPDITPGRIYDLLYDISNTSLFAASVAADSLRVREHIVFFLNRLRFTRTALNGNDLRQMGIPAGSQRKEILHRLLIARIDGEISTRQEEAEIVEKEYL